VYVYCACSVVWLLGDDMKTDLFEKVRAAFGKIGDTNPVPPQRPPHVNNFDGGDDGYVKRILDRMEVLLIAQDEGRMKRAINARRDISEHLKIDYFVVMRVIHYLFESKAIKARFDRESRNS